MTLEELRAIAAKASKVVGWYPYPKGDGYHPGKASVRGPYGRWFLVEGGVDANGELYEGMADLNDDAKFAAAALNNFAPLLDEIDRLRSALALTLSHTRACSYDRAIGDEGDFCTCDLARRRALVEHRIISPEYKKF